MPKVSVVMPVYNRSARVGAAIESILGQTMNDFELLIVNDGSTDDTMVEINKYAQTEERIKVLDLPTNAGQGLARAIGNEAAIGDYIAVMDSDDVSLPNRLERQTHFMDQNAHITLAGSGAVKVLGARRLKMTMPENDSKIKARLLLLDATFVHSTTIMRRHFLKERNVNYGTQRRGDDDYDFFTKMVEAGAAFHNMPDTLVEYHRHSSNITKTIAGLSRDKLPLRKNLLRLYFPYLTNKETDALGRLMQAEGKITIKTFFEGFIAAERALQMQGSQYGEDHAELNNIIGSTLKRAERHIKSFNQNSLPRE